MSRPVIELITVIFLASVALGLTMPLLAVSLSYGGTSAGAIGVNAMTPALGIVSVSLVAPIVIQRLGAKLCMLCCTISFSILLILMSINVEFWYWLFLRFFVGASTGLFWIVAELMLNASAPTNTRGFAVAGFTAANSVGLGVGPLVLVITGLGWPAYATAIGLFILSLLIALAGSFPELEVRREAKEKESLVKTIGRAPDAFAIAFASGFVGFAQIVLLPIFVLHTGGSVSFGAVCLSSLLLASIVFRLAFAQLFISIGQTTLIYSLFIIAIGSNALFLFISDQIWTIGILFLWGGAISSMYTVALKGIGDEFCESAAGLATASSALRGSYHFGNALGPIVAGVGLDQYGRSGFVLSCLVPMSIVLALLSLFLRRRDAKSTEAG